jgi:hypothetical protein
MGLKVGTKKNRSIGSLDYHEGVEHSRIEMTGVTTLDYNIIILLDIYYLCVRKELFCGFVPLSLHVGARGFPTVGDDT